MTRGSMRLVQDDLPPARLTLQSKPHRNFYGTDLDADYFEHNSKLRGALWYGDETNVGFASMMLTDPIVRQSRDHISGPVSGAHWGFRPGADTPQAQLLADACTHVFLECLDFRGEIRRIVNDYLLYGVSLTEQTEVMRELPSAFGVRGPAIAPARWVGVPPRTVAEWHAQPSDPTRLAAITQRSHTGAAPIEVESRLLRCTWEQSEDNFAGFAVGRSAWSSWFSKQVLLRVEQMSHEKNHLQLPFITRPEAPDVAAIKQEIDAIATSMRDFRAHQNGYYQLPAGFSVDFKSGVANTPIALTIDRLDFTIAHAYGAGYTLLGRKSGGSYSLSSTLKKVADVGVSQHAHKAETLLNHGTDGWSPVERFCRLNFDPRIELPSLVAHNLPTENWTEMLPMLYEAADRGLVDPAGLDSFILRVLKVTRGPA